MKTANIKFRDSLVIIFVSVIAFIVKSIFKAIIFFNIKFINDRLSLIVLNAQNRMEKDVKESLEKDGIIIS